MNLYFSKVSLIWILFNVSYTLAEETVKQNFIDWKYVKPKICYNDVDYVAPVKAVDILIGIIINDFYEISEERMEFGLQILLIEAWRVSALNLTKNQSWGMQENVAIPDYVADCLWKPDTIFDNAKDSKLYEHTLKNTYMKLSHMKHVFRNSRYRLTISCPMAFHYYPMDSQRCSLVLSLLSSNMNEAKLEWDTRGFLTPVLISTDCKPQHFDIKILNHTTVIKTENEGMDKKQKLCVHFLFIRSLTASIVNTYVPSFLVVLLSMVSFYLDVNAVPGRVTLGVTSLLTLSTQIVHTRSYLPPLNYMTAMDIWLLGCVVMVFMSLLEFTLAQSLSRKSLATEIEVMQLQQQQQRKKAIPIPINAINAWKTASDNALVLRNTSSARTFPDVTNNEATTTIKPNLKTSKWVHRAHKDSALDRASRFVFPFTMTVFTVTYWTYFYYKTYNY